MKYLNSIKYLLGVGDYKNEWMWGGDGERWIGRV